MAAGQPSRPAGAAGGGLIKIRMIKEIKKHGRKLMKLWFRKLKLYFKLYFSTFRKKKNKDDYGNDVYPH